MEKVHNLRDLGYLKVGNKQVKSGCFYRSARLDDATENDINELKALGLKHIFDFRDASECDDASVYQKIGVEHENYPANLNNGKLFKIEHGSNLQKLLIKVHLKDIYPTYETLPFNNVGYKKMIEAMLKRETPFLQHCTAGKDRTGVGVMLILTILGVSKEDIFRDYMSSMQVVPYLEEVIGKRIPKPLRPYFFKRYRPLFIVDEKLLQCAYDAIEKKYGSMSAYLYEEFGLTEETLNELSDYYLE